MSGNAYPSNFVSSTAATATSVQAYTTDATNQSRGVKGDISADAVNRSRGSIASAPKGAGDDATTTVLVVIIAVMGAGYISIAILFWLYRRSTARTEDRRQRAEWVTETAALNSTFDKYGGDE